jgi:hypothetical protein
MTPVKLGQFKIPVMISIAGSVDPPLQSLLSCTCTGPKIVLDQTEVWACTHNCTHLSSLMKQMYSPFDIPKRRILHNWIMIHIYMYICIWYTYIHTCIHTCIYMYRMRCGIIRGFLKWQFIYTCIDIYIHILMYSYT